LDVDKVRVSDESLFFYGSVAFQVRCVA